MMSLHTCDVTDRGLCGQFEGHLTVIPVVSVVTLFLKHSGGVAGVGGGFLFKQDSETVNVFTKHMIPANSHETSCYLVV